MDHPDPIVTLSADPAGLSAARSRKLRSAVTTVEHCLGLWQPFIAAATPHPLHITVTTADDPDAETAPTVGARLGTDRRNLHLQVPHSLLQKPPSRLAAQILDIVVPALVTLAEHHPHPQPPARWQSTEEWQPPPHDPEPAIQLGDLHAGDVLLIGRHDGTPADADSRERALEAYLCERLEEPGIAGRDSAFTTSSAVSWTLELLHKDW